MAIFERRPGSADNFTVQTQNRTYTFTGDDTVTVTDAGDIAVMQAHPDVQVAEGGAPPVVDDVYLKDGVLVRASDDSPVSESSRLVNAGEYDRDVAYSADDVVRVERRAFVLEEHEGEPPPPLDDNVPWDGPEYPAAAEQATVTGRTIGAVGRAGDEVFLGYGDYDANTGPVDVAAVAVDDLLAEPTTALADFQTEQIILFRRLADGRVLAPAVDARGSTGGHYAERATNGTWASRLNRISAGALHVFDLVEGPDGVLFACGSGYEAGTSGDSGAAIWKSVDDGATWTLDYIISGPNAQELNRFYWLAVVGDVVYARNSELGEDGVAEQMLQWTVGGGWDEVAHDLQPFMAPGQPFRTGYVLPGNGLGLCYFDGTDLTVLDEEIVGFDVGDDGALYYCTTGGRLKRVPASGALTATIIDTIDRSSTDDLAGMVALSDETFVFGGTDAHVRAFTIGQRNPWRPLAPKDVTGPDGKVLVDLLPPQADVDSPVIETIPFAEDVLTVPAFPGGGVGWTTDANLYVQGSTGWLLGQLVLNDYADIWDFDNLIGKAMLLAPAWMGAVPSEIAELDATFRDGYFGVPLVMASRRLRVTMTVQLTGFAVGSKAEIIARIPETIIGPNVRRFEAGNYYTVTVDYPFEMVWGDIPEYDEDFNIVTLTSGLYGGIVPDELPADHLALLADGSVDAGALSTGFITLNSEPATGTPRAFSFPLGDRP